MSKLLFTGSEWDFQMLQTVFAAIEDVGLNDLKLDVYPNQIEVITAEQMSATLNPSDNVSKKVA